MTTTTDGGLLFVAEAGALAVIDADDSSSYGDPIKLEKISSQGVRAVEVVLDPSADPENGPTAEATVLYVAGGRLGLWVMQADPRAGQPMPAARIDDASDATDATAQDSARWCNDVATMRLGEDRYLIATFAQWGCSHIRFYPLPDARDVLADHPGEETGNELEAVLEVRSGGNCTFQQPRHESFALGLAVDDSDEEETFVYVAMGPYGLVRIRFTDDTDITVKQVTDGPWFGDGSHYATMTPADPFGGIYDDFEILAGTPLASQREHAPYFCDVAVQHDGEDTYLWAAVDHLGVVRFNVTNPSAWATSMAIDHQEGLRKTSADFGDDPRIDAHIRLVAESSDTTLGEPDDVNVRNYAHRVRVANEADPPALAVGVANELFYGSNPILNEGRTLGHLGNSAEGLEPNLDPAPLTGGTLEYTLLYDLDALVPKPPANGSTTPAYQHVAFLREGGDQVHLPEDHPVDGLLVFGGRFDPLLPDQFFEDAQPTSSQKHNSTFRASFDWPTGTLNASMFERLAADRPGRLAYDISHSRINPELLYPGSNDAHVAVDGFLGTCGGEIVQLDYDPGSAGDDGRGTFGIIFNPKAVWPDGTGHEFLWGLGVPTGESPHWALFEMDPGEDLCDDPPTRLPDREKRIFVQSPLDNFLSRGRGYFSTGELDLDYDAFVATPDFSGDELVFGGRTGTPGGIVVLDRAILEDRIHDDVNVDDGDIIANSVATLRELVTHPEFANVYDTSLNPTPPQNWLGPTNPTTNPYGTRLAGRVNTYVPRLLTVPGPAQSAYSEHWVLAVPCAAVQLPADLPTFTDDTYGEYEPTWAPDQVFVDNYDRAMVRVFDVNDYDHTIDDGATLPAYTLIGPRDTTAAYRIEPLRWDGRDYLFVADFGGTLLVWDVTDLLDETPGTVITSNLSGYDDFFVGEWLAPLSVSDDVKNNVWSVAVDPVTWTDAGGQHDEVYVYVLVGRVGIEVLRFLPDEGPGERLEHVERIEVPYGQGGLEIRISPGDDTVRTLLVTDALAGLRTFEYGE